MATTGFWPVRGKLKKVLDYADNPDKTTAKEYLDEDLYQALRYTDSAVLISTVVEMKYRKRARTPLNVLYQQDEYERTHPRKEPRSEIDKYLDGLVYEMNHTNDSKPSPNGGSHCLSRSRSSSSLSPSSSLPASRACCG